MAKWTKKREQVSCPFAKKEKEKYVFDVTKADKIFDVTSRGADQAICESYDSVRRRIQESQVLQVA